MARKTKLLQRICSLVICFVLILQQSGFSQIAGQVDLSGYITGMMNHSPTDAFRPVHLRYFSYNSQDNSFKVLVDKGDFLKEHSAKGIGHSEKAKSVGDGFPVPIIHNEAKKLLQYFLTGVSLEDESFWVNLRPDSEDQIIDSWLAKTDVGKIMLEADLQLKKDTALFTSPQTKEGREYWNKLYKKAEELYGTETVDIPTLTRPWIVPGEIIIRETNDDGSLKIEAGKKIIPSAYIYKASLKVMLEEDYLKDSNQKPVTSNQNIVVADLGRQNNGRASSATTNDPRQKQLNTYSTQLIKELIIPKLTKEVNSSKRYAALRQVYYSLILARWFKTRFNVGARFPRPTGYTHLINSRNLTGLTSQTPWSKDTYFKQYQKSFQQGEYNIKEPIRTQVIRSYFSGGIQIGSSAIVNNGLSAKTDIPEALLNRSGTVLIQGKPGASGLEMSVSASPIDNRSRVEGVLKEIRRNSGLPISTKVTKVPTGVSDNALWSKTLGVLYFDKDVYRRVESVDLTDQDNNVTKEGEITTGTLVDDIDNRGYKINELGRQYDVRTGPYKSIRIGSELQPRVNQDGTKTKGFLKDRNAKVTPKVYFMHRGVFANKNDILKAFYGDNKLRFDITVIPPAVWGEEYAKTVGHYHFSQEYVKRIGDPNAVADYPEVYQVVSGEVLWLMQKCKINETTIRGKVEAVRQRGATQDQIDKTEVKAIQAELDRGEIEDFIAVRAKAGDIVIMLPGYGHVSVNISETEPLVMADWLTWHQKSYYGSFEKKSGAAYYVIKNDQGQPELVLNPEYTQPEKTRQMTVKDEIARFGLTRGVPIYNLVNLDNKEFSPKTRFLYHPERFSAVLTPERTLNDIEPAEQIPVSSAVEVEAGAAGNVSPGIKLVDGAKVVTIANTNIKPGLWGTAGYRGVKSDPNDFSMSNVNRQVAGFAEEVLKRMSNKEYTSINGKTVRVAFAFDSRVDSDRYADEMAKVLSAYSGFEVYIIDEPLPTPVVARLTQEKRADAYDFAFHVTPSHNQLQYGGIKLLFKGAVNEHMWTHFFEKRANAKMEYPVNPQAQPNKVKVVEQIKKEYLQEVFPGLIEKFATFKKNNPNSQFTIDLMDGAMASFAGFFEDLGMEVVRSGRMKDINYAGKSYVLADGKTVGFAPDPTQEAFYKDEESYQKFLKTAPEGSIYFLIDGDGDRLVTIVKKNGKPINIKPNQFGPLAADYILINRLLPITQIVRTYVTTAGMDAVAEYHKLKKPIIVPVGSKYFNRFRDAICLEESGHFVAGDFFDDTIYQMGLILSMMSDTNKDVFTLLDETQKKIEYKGIDKRDDFENLSPEVKAKFTAPLTGTAQEVKRKSKEAVDAIVKQSGKELLEALVVVEGEYGIGRVVTLNDYVESLFTDKPLKLESNNRGLIIRFKGLAWGGARSSGTGNTGRLYTEGRESQEERQKIADAFIDVLGLPRASSALQVSSLLSLEEENIAYPFVSSLSVSSSLQSAPEKMGAVDFRLMNINYQAMGSFKALDLKLPRLSKSYLDKINIDGEIESIRKMVSSGKSPSGTRIIELVAACEQKGRMAVYSRDLLLCLADAFELEAMAGDKSSTDAQTALVFIDSRS